MIALDTNVLVRFLVEDDARQGAAAASRIERAIAGDETLFVTDVVLCELVWVLSGSYKVPRARIGAIIRELLRTRHIAFESADALARAVDAYAHGKGDFADYVIRERARDAGCPEVVTFDRALLREDGFVAP